VKNVKTKNKIPVVVSLAIVMFLITGIGLTILEAEDDKLLTKDAYIEDMLAYSTAVESIEKARNDLATSLSEFSSSIAPLKSVYDQLPTYKSLGDLYEVEVDQVNHIEYLNLLLAGGPTLPEPQLTEFNNLAVAVGADVVMTVEQYGTYLQLKGMFQAFGIPDHHVSKETEYNTFISTIYVAPLSMQQALLSLNRQVESLPKTLENGGSNLYNTVVMMEDILKLLDKSYVSSEQDYQRSLAKYEKGLMSEVDYLKIKNNQTSARINRDVMARNIKNLKMQLNVMRGVSPKDEFSVEPYRELVITLKDLDYFKEQALASSDSIKDKEEAVFYQQLKFDYVADYFSASADDYKLEQLQLDLYKLELQEVLTEVEVTSINNYTSVVHNQEELLIARKDVSDVNSQLVKLKANAEAGFIAEYVLSDFNTLVLQKTNTVNTKLRDYIESLEELYSYSGLDFPY